MEIALLVILSIAIVGQITFFGIVYWVTKDDKKIKGKNNIEMDIYLTEDKLYEIDTEIRKLEAEFKCTKDHLDYLYFKKKDMNMKIGEHKDGKEER